MSVCPPLSKRLSAPLSIARYGSSRLIDGKVVDFISVATVTRRALDVEIVQNAWLRFARLLAALAGELKARQYIIMNI